MTDLACDQDTWALCAQLYPKYFLLMKNYQQQTLLGKATALDDC